MATEKAQAKTTFMIVRDALAAALGGNVYNHGELAGAFGVGASFVLNPGLVDQLGQVAIRFRLPELTLGRISWQDLLLGSLVLGVPQAPLTLGNAIVGVAAENNALFPLLRFAGDFKPAVAELEAAHFDRQLLRIELFVDGVEELGAHEVGRRPLVQVQAVDVEFQATILQKGLPHQFHVHRQRGHPRLGADTYRLRRDFYRDVARHGANLVVGKPGKLILPDPYVKGHSVLAGLDEMDKFL